MRFYLCILLCSLQCVALHFFAAISCATSTFSIYKSTCNSICVQFYLCCSLLQRSHEPFRRSLCISLCAVLSVYNSICVAVCCCVLKLSHEPLQRILCISLCAILSMYNSICVAVCCCVLQLPHEIVQTVLYKKNFSAILPVYNSICVAAYCR